MKYVLICFLFVWTACGGGGSNNVRGQNNGGKYQMPSPFGHYWYILRNLSAGQVMLIYHSHKKKHFIDPGQCVYFQEFSTPIGQKIQAQGRILCGESNDLCPATSFTITKDLIIEENSNSFEERPSDSLCDFLGDSETELAPPVLRK